MQMQLLGWMVLLALAGGWGPGLDHSYHLQTPDTKTDPQPMTPVEDATSPVGEQSPATKADEQIDPEALMHQRRLPADWLDLWVSGEPVAIIRIEGLIYDFTLESLRRRVDKALAGGARLIVIELSTKGGLVTSALDIAKYIKNLQVPTVAWINNEAYSAGIMIAASCDAIVMSASSATGDCAPISGGGQSLAPTERAKALTPILEEFRDSAAANHYDFALFHAMCELGVEVYQIENPQTGEKRLVNQADYKIMVRGMSRSEVEDEMKELAAAHAKTDSDLPAHVVTAEVAGDNDRGKWQLIKQVHDGKTLLTVSQDRAKDIGLSKATVPDVAALKTLLRTQNIKQVTPSWSESLAGWLVHPMVRSVLILGLLLGLYVEMQTPGLGFPGGVALVCLLMLIGAPFLIGLAEIWHLILLVVGIGLLFVELFITPGFAVMGVTGLILILAGLVLSIVPSGGSGPTFLPAPEMLDQLGYSFLWTMAGLAMSIAGFAALTRYYESIPILNRLILQSPIAAGPQAPVHLSGDEAVGEGTVQVGDVGQTSFDLRPTGRARFGEKEIDVVSQGQWIAAGQPVRVLEVRGNRIVVAPTDNA